MSQERTEQENPKTFTAKVRNVGYVPHKLSFTEEEMEYASTLDELEATRLEIDRLNAVITGQAEAIREQTAKVQERDERIEVWERRFEIKNNTAEKALDTLHAEVNRLREVIKNEITEKARAAIGHRHDLEVRDKEIERLTCEKNEWISKARAESGISLKSAEENAELREEIERLRGVIMRLGTALGKIAGEDITVEEMTEIAQYAVEIDDEALKGAE